MKVEIIDDWEAHFVMDEHEFLEFRDVQDAAHRPCELIQVSTRSDNFVATSPSAFDRVGVYVHISKYTVRVNPDWRGALEDYTTAAFLEGKIDAAEAATLTELASA